MMRVPARLSLQTTSGEVLPAEQKSDPGSFEAWFSEFGHSNRTAAGISVNQISALQVSAVMSCTSILSEDVAKVPPHVWRPTKGGGKKIIGDHPLEMLFRKPNSWQTRLEFFEMMMVALVLRGNCYACIIKDYRGRPISLVPVNPDRVWIYEAPDGSIFYMVSRRGPHDMAALDGLLDDVPGEPLPLMVPAENMLHVRWMSLDNSLWGTSRIGLAREAIALSLSQQELAARLSGNNTNLGGVLTTDAKLNDDVIKRLKANWKEKYGGVRNAGETAVLEQGLKWQPIGMTSVDAEFLNSRKFSIEEIARIFRVPLYKLNVSEQRTTGTTLVQADQEYLNSVISSYCERFKAKLEATFDLDGINQFVEFDYSHFLKADILTRLTAARLGVIGMVYTPNEARAPEGLPPVPGGDVLYQPVNVAPIGFTPVAAGGGLGSDTTGEPAAGGDGDAAAPPDSGAPSI